MYIDRKSFIFNVFDFHKKIKTLFYYSCKGAKKNNFIIYPCILKKS